MRRTVALVALALVGTVTPAASAALGTTCVTGRPEVYSGCTVVIVGPGYCYVWSTGSILGRPYYQNVPC